MTVKEGEKMYSSHYVRERIERERRIQQIGIGHEVATFTVDRNHPNGAELHTITSTGIIIIRNKCTKKMVTKLIARPGQIRRYFPEITPEIQKIIDVAYNHQKLHYNEI